MKLTQRIFIIGIITFALLSCSSNENNTNEKTIKEISIGQLDYKIYKKTFGTNVSNDGSKLDTSGGYFLQINLEITNKEIEPIKFDTAMFRLINSTGRAFPYSYKYSELLGYIDTCLNGVEIHPNTTKQGFIIFNVPTIDEYILELNNGNWQKQKNSLLIKPVD